MPSIEAVSIRKILDSRGNPTVEVDLWAGRILGRAAAASGASTGAHEPPAFPKGGVNEAVTVFRGEVAPRITGHDADNVFANARVHRSVGEALARKFPDEPLGRGDEGAWIARLKDEDALALLMDICKSVGRDLGFRIQPALDLAASEFYREGKYRYRDRSLTREGQIDLVERFVREYSLFSVEDPFDQEDFGAFTELTKRIGDRCKVIGDDIFVTNVERLRRGIEQHAANAILIKPNQIGTLSETRAAVDLAHSAGYATVMSHRSGETTDDTIAHLAVAFGCLGIKTGTVGGERIAKLNELIRIEEQLQAGA